MYRLVVLDSDLAIVLRQLEHGAEQVLLPIDVLYVVDGVELLVRNSVVGLGVAAGIARFERHGHSSEACEEAGGDNIAVQLALDWKSDRPTAKGVVRWGRTAPWQPLDELRIVGEGMEDLPIRNGSWQLVAEQRPPFERDGHLSRVVGAIGGSDTMASLQRLRIAVVGCGGMGSLLADQMARLMGPAGQMDLLDCDVLEPANLPAWVTSGIELVGKPKAEVLSDHLQKSPFAPLIRSHVASILDSGAKSMLKRSQLLLCCVDCPRARLAAAFYAAVYARPLVVVESAVFLGTSQADHTKIISEIISDDSEKTNHADIMNSRSLPHGLCASGQRSYLADIRLILPRQGQCLLCSGGVGRALSVPTAPFWRHRAGTLMPLNLETVGRAVRLLLGWFKGDVTRSTHLRLDEATGGTGRWQEITHFGRNGCLLCERLGRGDAAREDLSHVLLALEKRGS